MNVLLLGGTGAMGGYLAKRLSDEHENLVAVTSRRSLKSTRDNLVYFCGNAHEDSFLDSLFEKRYDAVVDFMNYGYDEFATRYQKMLQVTGQYVFLSSARVYANSVEPLTEKSARLLEVSTDKDFLETQRYALRKARQEDLLNSSGSLNYTIIRPYKTFSEERFQLGAYEKEQWLQRALSNKSIPVRQGIMDKLTTLTAGDDVADVIFRLIGNSKARGETVQIASPESLKWSEIVGIYRKVLKELVGIDLSLIEYEGNDELELLFEGGYQIKYDVLWNRVFNSWKVEELVGEIKYTSVRESLESCLRIFIGENRAFLNTSTDFMRICDRMESCR